MNTTTNNNTTKAKAAPTSTVRVEKYWVDSHIQETTCDFCGRLLFIGDLAFEATSGNTDGEVYCSRSCAERDEI